MPPFGADPNKTVEELLSEVQTGATQGAGASIRSSVFAIAPFAALLVRLSRDAEKTARTIRLLTWAIVGLTIILVALTVVVVWFTWVLIQQDADQKRENAKLADQTTAQDQLNEK